MSVCGCACVCVCGCACVCVGVSGWVCEAELLGRQEHGKGLKLPFRQELGVGVCTGFGIVQ